MAQGETFLQKYGTKLFTILSAALMLVFISPLGRKNNQRTNPVIGTAGKMQFTEHDLQLATAEWDMLSHRLVVQHQGPNGELQWSPLVLTLGSQSVLARNLMPLINDDKRLLMLLTYEAGQRGLTPPAAQVDAQAKAPFLAIAQPDGRMLPIDDDPDNGDLAKAALSAYGSITGLANDAIATLKVSRPSTLQMLAEEYQQLTLRAATFPAQPDLSKVPDPTPQQLQGQFDKYADVQQPAPVTAQNPYGFGYKYPPRVSLQYIEVPIEQVRKVVRGAKSDYDWEVAARAYYLKHQDEFAATQPAATQPATTQAALVPATRGATTRPFADVKDDVINRVMQPDMDELSTRIENKISGILQSDWAAYSAANPTTVPAGAAAAAAKTATGVPFNGDEYLSSVAKRIQSEDGVICKVQRMGRLMDTTQLRGTPSLAELLEARNAGGQDLVEIAGANPQPLSPYQPADVLHDFLRSAFFVRFADVQPPERPASLDEVKAQVIKDFKVVHAMDMATAQANKLLAAADRVGLDHAVTTAATQPGGANIEVVTTTPFAVDRTPPTSPEIPPEAEGQFRDGVKALLQKLERHEKPVGVIVMPAAEKVLVVELVNLEPIAKSSAEVFADELNSRAIQTQLQTPAMRDWFDPDQVMLRLHFVEIGAKPRVKSPAGQ